MTYARLSTRSAEQTQSLPPKPKTCGCHGCQNPTTILFASVLEHGRPRVGSMIDFEDSRGNLKPNFDFREWIARCDTCYLNDITRAKRSSRDYLDRLHPEIT